MLPALLLDVALVKFGKVSRSRSRFQILKLKLDKRSTTKAEQQESKVLLRRLVPAKMKLSMLLKVWKMSGTTTMAIIF